MAMIVNHSRYYIERAVRTQKKEYVNSLIRASFFAEKNQTSERSLKTILIERLNSFLALYRDDVKGYTDGVGGYGPDQFDKDYTIGHEMGIWKNSSLELTDYAKKVALDEITIVQYFDRVFLNFFQPVNNEGVHPLYRILKYMLEKDTSVISSSEASDALGVIIEDQDITGLFHYLGDTSYFKEIKNGLEYISDEPMRDLIKKCNIRYEKDGYEKYAKTELNSSEAYSNYLTSQKEEIPSDEDIAFEIESEEKIEDRKLRFKKWLANSGRFTPNSIRNYSYYIGYIKKQGYTDYDLYTINDITIIEDLIYKFGNDEKYIAWNKEQHGAPSSALTAYKKFLEDENNPIEEKSIIEKFTTFYINNLEIIKEKENVAPKEVRKEFTNEYSLEKIKSLDLKDYSMGLDDDSTFCRKVEGGKYRDYGVRCSGDPNGAAHWGIFFSKEKQVYLDSDYNVLDNPEEYWNQFKNELYDFLINLNNENPKFSDSYPMLKNMSKTLPKLCFMYYPDKFLNFVTKGMLQELYNVFGLEYTYSTPADQLSYELNKYIRENVPITKDEISEYISGLLWAFRERLQEDIVEEDNQTIDDIDRITGGYNKIYYGVPGSGKSYKVDEEFNKDRYKIYRTTFHPEYTNSDFVGQIIPVVKDNNVEYKFHPGAFTLALKYALNHKDEKVCLIIEEINRGNSSAIFGDIFQLLDRDDNGKSKYSIFNGPIIDYLNNIETNEVYLPSNLWIVATMNTSDQNVFTLDTAFKRRWKMEYIKNVFADNPESDELKNKVIMNSEKYPNVTWEKFVTKINKHIISDTSGVNGEDKQLGMYFVSVEEIENPKEFAEKILSYLWEDVAKINTSYWFGNISSYDELIDAYNNNYLDIFNSIFEEEIAVMDEVTIKSVGE